MRSLGSFLNGDETLREPQKTLLLELCVVYNNQDVWGKIYAVPFKLCIMQSIFK